MHSTFKISDETNVPLKWVFAVIMGCGVTLATAVIIGKYVGNNDARASAHERRLTDLEETLRVIPLIDRRLARIEGASGVKAPAKDRFPASGDE